MLLQQLALLHGFDLDDTDPVGAGFRPHRHRMRQARLSRPRGVVRRPRFRRRADGDAAEPGLQRRPPQAGRRPRLDRIAPGPARTAASRISWSAAPSCVCRRPGSASRRSAPLPRGIGEPTTSPLGVVAGDTCHVDVIDRWGNMVSATPSGGWLQSSPVIPELGFCLGTRLQISWLDESSPSSLAAGQAAAQHPVADARLQGRRAVHGVRHARAATGRTNGRCSSSCITCITG